jgi:structural maintenance of chromosome 1
LSRFEEKVFGCRLSEQALQDQKQLRSDLQSDVGSSKDRVHEIQKQLDDVLEQLGDARTDKHEDARRKKKQEIVERFKSNYPGVVRGWLELLARPLVVVGEVTKIFVSV